MKFELPPPIPSRPQAKKKAEGPPKKEDDTQPVKVVRRAPLPPSLVVPPPLPSKKSPAQQSQQRTLQPSLLREFEAGIGPPVSPAPQSSQKIQPPENEKVGKTVEGPTKPLLPQASPQKSAAPRWSLIIILTFVTAIIAATIYSMRGPVISQTSSVTSSTTTPAEDQVVSPAATPTLTAPPPLGPAPPTWDQFKNSDEFKAATPEARLVGFDRWHKDVYNYLSQLPDWSTNADKFNTGAAKHQAELSEAAGGITPDQARVKVATDALIAARKLIGKPLSAEQEHNVLLPFGQDISNAYYHRGTYRIVHVVEGDPLNVRQGPGSNYPVVIRIPPGVRGILLGPRRVANGSTIWQEISAQGYTGWVNETYLEAESAPP